jgi:hypothetical protein
MGESGSEGVVGGLQSCGLKGGRRRVRWASASLVHVSVVAPAGVFVLGRWLACMYVGTCLLAVQRCGIRVYKVCVWGVLH